MSDHTRDRRSAARSSRSGAARRTTAAAKLDTAATALNRLLVRSMFKSYTAADVAHEAELNLSTVKHLTMTRVRNRAKALRDARVQE
jgi:hypothetical protein